MQSKRSLKTAGRKQYCADEAAGKLGVSVEQLRELIGHHILKAEELPRDAEFRASDLVLLKILADTPQETALVS